jgi:hypothetical protein
MEKLLVPSLLLSLLFLSSCFLSPSSPIQATPTNKAIDSSTYVLRNGTWALTSWDSLTSGKSHLDSLAILGDSIVKLQSTYCRNFMTYKTGITTCDPYSPTNGYLSELQISRDEGMTWSTVVSLDKQNIISMATFDTVMFAGTYDVCPNQAQHFNVLLSVNLSGHMDTISTISDSDRTQATGGTKFAGLGWSFSGVVKYKGTLYGFSGTRCFKLFLPDKFGYTYGEDCFLMSNQMPIQQMATDDQYFYFYGENAGFHKTKDYGATLEDVGLPSTKKIDRLFNYNSNVYIKFKPY